MAAIVKDPNVLTKEKLKTELVKNKIPLPRSDSKKIVYVDLYRKHVIDSVSKSEPEQQTLEFSSDDEDSAVITESPVTQESSTSTPDTVSPTGTPDTVILTSEENNTPAMHLDEVVDVYSLKDEELGAMLRKFGVDVGPILVSTRKVYQRKLEKILREGPTEEPTQEYSTEEDMPEDEEVPEVIETQTFRENYRTSPRKEKPRISEYSVTPQKQLGTPQKAPIRKRDVTSTYEREVRREERTENIVTQVEAPPKPQKKGLSIWIQIAIFLVVAVLIFLVIQNMEPADTNPAKRQLADATEP